MLVPVGLTFSYCYTFHSAVVLSFTSWSGDEHSCRSLAWGTAATLQ